VTGHAPGRNYGWREVNNELRLTIETEQEDDGRWIAEIPQVPGVMVYGETRKGAAMRAVVLALRVIADEIEHGERRADALAGVTWPPPMDSTGFSSDARC